MLAAAAVILLSVFEASCLRDIPPVDIRAVFLVGAIVEKILSCQLFVAPKLEFLSKLFLRSYFVYSFNANV